MPIRELNGKECKSYLLIPEGGKEAFLVDPLLEKTEDYLRLLRSEGLKLAGTLDTHTHADHLSACAALRDRLDVPYMMHSSARQECVTRRLEDGESVGLGKSELRLFHTPGHTKDSLSFLFEGNLLSGDFLFIGTLGAGRLDLPGGDPAQHQQSLRHLDGLPDATALLPGHDYQGRVGSTLGEERKLNPVLKPRAREEYLRWWSERRPPAADWMGDVVRANVACTRDLNAARIPQGQAACACAPAPAGQQEKVFPALASPDLAKMLSSKASKPFLLDVRTQEEYNDELGHIVGTVLIPVDELPARVREVPAGEVVVICRSGKRAARAAATLGEAGRDKIWVLTGGMLAWNEARLPTA